MGFLAKYPKLDEVTTKLDAFLREKHPSFFGANANHPELPLKPSKVIHDGLWGTFSFALKKLYEAMGTKRTEQQPAGDRCSYPYYDTYRLRLPKRSMHVVEQIVICKMMLYTYVYHHAKVRAAEGLLERTLDALVAGLKLEGRDEWSVLEWFLEATDADLIRLSVAANDPTLKERAYRIVNRLLPREVFRLSASEAAGAQKSLLADFLPTLRDRQKGDLNVKVFEMAIGEQLLRYEGFTGMDCAAALLKAGVWLDVPKAPSFEDTQKMISRAHGGREHVMFPIHAWQHAYTSYRWYVRIFAYSEFTKVVCDSAKAAMKKVLKIEDDSFYKTMTRLRF